MRTGKHRAHEDFQVYDIDVFYNGNLIVAGFFSKVLFNQCYCVSHQMHWVLWDICYVWYSAVQELMNEVYNSIHLCPVSVFALSLTPLCCIIYRQSVQ